MQVTRSSSSLPTSRAPIFKQKEVDRIILYRIPKGGIPEEGIEEGAVIAARVPIYGTKDAGRGFWLRLKEVVLSKGYCLNQILPTVFTLRHNGAISGVMSCNADDLLYGSLLQV